MHIDTLSKMIVFLNIIHILCWCSLAFLWFRPCPNGPNLHPWAETLAPGTSSSAATGKNPPVSATNPVGSDRFSGCLLWKTLEKFDD